MSHHEEHTEHKPHASDRDYYVIAIILSVITLAEVFYPIVTEGNQFLAPYFMPILGVMSLVKFALVAGYFMHLKYDPKILRRIFYFSAVVAIIMIVAFLFLFEVVI